jgi:hypothetical protein
MDTIALIALIVAFIAMIGTFKGNKIANKALNIATNEHLDRNNDIEIYLINIKKQRQNNISWLYLNISLINNATLSKAQVKNILEVYYVDKDQKIQIIKLERIKDPEIMTKNTSELEYPLNIPSLTTVTGHIYYKIPEFLKDIVIKKFRFVLLMQDKKQIAIESELWENKDV